MVGASLEAVAQPAGLETLDGRAVEHVELTPLQPASYRTAELWIDVQDAHVRKVVIREENAAHTYAVLDKGPEGD